MKVGGKQVTRPSIKLEIVPRDPEPLVFKGLAVESFDEFDAQCPEPKAMTALTKTGVKVLDQDKDYLEQVRIHGEKKMAWLVIATLEPSEIEWEKVQRGKPNTWTKWKDEMKSSGLTEIEVNRIFNFVLECNSLNEEKLAIAREAFLLGQALESVGTSGRHTEPESTQSGEPAPESE